VHILLGSGAGTFPTTNAYIDGQNCAGIARADFDGDGIADLAVSEAVSNSLFLLKGNGSGGVGDGTFAPPVTLSDCCFPVHVIAADLDGNGRPDALTCDYQASAVGLFRDGCAPSSVPACGTRIAKPLG